MRLIVVHHHLRPGGVRRVIEQSLPWIARNRIREIVMVSGEVPERAWFSAFAGRIPNVRITCEVEPAFGYWAEIQLRSSEVRRRVCQVLHRLLEPFQARSHLVWIHNPGLARNLPMSAALARVCQDHDVPVIWHHHDWWFDNRWARWSEIRDSGFHTLAGAVRASVPEGCRGAHVAINRADVARLRAGFPGGAHWLPNVLEAPTRPSAKLAAQARAWLERHHGLPRNGEFWLAPCRFVRRKNLLEAVLLARWLLPKGHLITTGGPSSRDEVPAWNRVNEAARAHGWKVRFSVLADGNAASPSVAALIAASEALLLTSVQEGFGLPFLEAATFGKPILGRRLAQVVPDLESLGLRFPHLYDELWIAPSSLDWPAEVRRQRQLWMAWRQRLPRTVRSRIQTPDWLENPNPTAIPFGRLTLTGQLEVLEAPTRPTLDAARLRNPWLRPGTEGSVAGRLQKSTGARQALQSLSGQAYARRFWRAIAPQGDGSARGHPRGGKSALVLEAFLDRTIAERHWYPMVWSPES